MSPKDAGDKTFSKEFLLSSNKGDSRNANVGQIVIKTRNDNDLFN